MKRFLIVFCALALILSFGIVSAQNIPELTQPRPPIINNQVATDIQKRAAEARQKAILAQQERQRRIVEANARLMAEIARINKRLQEDIQKYQRDIQELQVKIVDAHRQANLDRQAAAQKRNIDAMR